MIYSNKMTTNKKFVCLPKNRIDRWVSEKQIERGVLSHYQNLFFAVLFLFLMTTPFQNTHINNNNKQGKKQSK